jgi:hypothetical protein
MTTIQQSILIDAPLERVFAYISNYTHDPQWRSGVVCMKQEPLPPARLGTRIYEQFRLLGWRFETRAEVTSFKANYVSGFTALSSLFPLWGQRMVKADGAATRFTYQLTARLHGPYRYLRPLLIWQLNRQLGYDLRRLKEILEKQTRGD